MLKRIAVALALTIALTACGGGDGSSSPSASHTTLSPALAKVAFLKAMQKRYPNSFTGFSGNKVVSLGQTVCDAWGRGVSFARLVRAGATIYPAAEAETLVREATIYICPKYRPQLP